MKRYHGSHINQISLRLSSACYAIKVITPLMTGDTLKMIYYSYVHSIITYGIILWGNLPLNNVIFKIQKRIMTKSRSRDSCRHLFKQLGILPLQSQYIFSVLLFVVKKRKHLQPTKNFIALTQDLLLIYIFQCVT